jgi:hypothetical protein
MAADIFGELASLGFPCYVHASSKTPVLGGYKPVPVDLLRVFPRRTMEKLVLSRRMRVSFVLLHRGQSVDVTIL